MPHRKLAGDNRLDARLESGLGRLYFDGKISQDEYEAGVRYARFGLEYLETIDSPDPYGGELAEIDEEVCLRRKINFIAARKVLKDDLGRWGAVVVDRVVIYDEPVRLGDLEVLRAGLRALCGRYIIRMVVNG
jgi:hypothetical protein